METKNKLISGLLFFLYYFVLRSGGLILLGILLGNHFSKNYNASLDQMAVNLVVVLFVAALLNFFYAVYLLIKRFLK